ncbi:hypothetical protein ACS0TY_000342 [Phlomoides rotata]
MCSVAVLTGTPIELKLKESQFINKSLSALGDVISSLAVKSSHITYRYAFMFPSLFTSRNSKVTCYKGMCVT